uniref:Secreted protein n=1 Tax=Oryza glumipatula TaxID=40148 RepID=A0A0E0BFJ4_9ORYZ
MPWLQSATVVVVIIIIMIAATVNATPEVDGGKSAPPGAGVVDPPIPKIGAAETVAPQADVVVVAATVATGSAAAELPTAGRSRSCRLSATPSRHRPFDETEREREDRIREERWMSVGDKG